ncbi:MAG TPA: phosphotransferase [Pseudomonadales bacterium]
MSFPSSPDQLTGAWLGRVLGRRVDDFRVEPLGAGTGIIGLVTRIHLSGPGAPSSIIAKFPSPSADNRAVAATYDMYGREVVFYRSVAPEITLRVPACYHAELDRDTYDFVLLLEDLGHLRVGDQVQGCTADEAHRVIQGIARLHASTWGKPFAGTLLCHDNAAQRDGMMAGFRLGWPVVKEQFADLLPPGTDFLGEAMPNAVPGLLARMCRPPMSVAHADVRLDNVLFDDRAIALVDWQSVCTSAPEQDLAYFVTQSLPEPVRRAEDWVAVYHDALRREGIDCELAACRQRFRISALYLLCYAVVIAGTLDLGNERGRRLGRTLLGNCLGSLAELDAFDLAREMA